MLYCVFVGMLLRLSQRAGRLRRARNSACIHASWRVSGRLHYLIWPRYTDRLQTRSPAVVGNLWDVTDKDLDRYTRSCLEKFGLFGEMTNTMPLPQAIAAAREACSLRYLNGAAPVVWGIPVSLKM